MRSVAVLAVGFMMVAVACGGNASPGAPQPTPTTSPVVQQVEQAVRLGDIQGLLDLIEWQPTACGGPHGSTDLCPEGIASGTVLPMVYAGFSDTLLVTAETLRDALAQVLVGEPLDRTFLATPGVTEHRGRPIAGPVYYVGMEGAPRPVTPTFFWGDAPQQAGVFFELNAGSAKPIVEIGFLSETWTAEQQGSALSGETPAPTAE